VATTRSPRKSASSAIALPTTAPVAAPAAAPPPTNYDPLTISDDDLKKLPAKDRALVYHARLKASGWTPPAAKA